MLEILPRISCNFHKFVSLSFQEVALKDDIHTHVKKVLDLGYFYQFRQVGFGNH